MSEGRNIGTIIGPAVPIMVQKPIAQADANIMAGIMATRVVFENGEVRTAIVIGHADGTRLIGLLDEDQEEEFAHQLAAAIEAGTAARQQDPKFGELG